VKHRLAEGRALEAAGSIAAAVEAYRSALQSDAECAEARERLGRLLSVQAYASQERGAFDAAIELYEEALALAPGQAPAWNNLGNALRALGRSAEAVHAYREALALEPGFAGAHFNLAVALHQGGDGASAIASCREALRHDPALTEAALALGYLLAQEGDAEGALQAYRQAVAARPESADARFNHGMQLLQMGDFEAGWAEYEWRLRLPELEQFWPYRDRPRWDGAPLEGRTILLYAEQGLGDALHFVRYVPLVAARGGRVILQCQPKLRALFARVAGVSEVIAAGEAPPPFDLCCSLQSLPYVFRTRLETIPAQVPYLRADAAKAGAWQARLRTLDARLRVGLFWATDSKSTLSAARSLTLAQLEPLAAAAGVVFYSLQRGAAAAEAARPPAGMRLVDAGAELKDFDDDAALIENLDLVISINSATAQLVGALAKPVWTLIHFPPDWRWLLGRDDCPWYPHMRLFRQGRGEGWETVVARLVQALREELNALREGPRRPV
jgi:Flp pilus assembly protein TadD